MKLKIKKGATVSIIAGADKGKKGKVLEVNPTAMKLRIEGVKVMTHYDKKDGLKKLEGFIDYSNAKLVEAATVPKGKKTAKSKSASKSA